MISDHERNVINNFSPLNSTKKVDKLIRELKLNKLEVSKELITEIHFHIRKVKIQEYFIQCSKEWNIKRSRVHILSKAKGVDKAVKGKYYPKCDNKKPAPTYKKRITKMWMKRWKRSKHELRSIIPTKQEIESLKRIKSKKLKKQINKSAIGRKRAITYSSVSFQEYDGDILHTK